MPFKIKFSMTWLSWLSHCINFQTGKRIKELTDYRRYDVFGLFFSFLTKQKITLSSSRGRFRGLVGFEAKAKDFSFEVKAKELKMCRRGRPRNRRHF